MVKVKQEDYVLKHRAVFGLNARVVWERLGAGESDAEICDGLPDELHDWVTRVVGVLERQAYFAGMDAHRAFVNICASLPDGWTRKEFAAEAAKRDNAALLFMLLDGRDIRPAIWKSLRPSADWRPTASGEEAA